MADYIASKMNNIFGGGNPQRARPRPKIRKRTRPFSRGGMRYMVRIIVPSTQGETKSISNSAFLSRISEVRRELSLMFGGYTSVQAVGGWVNDKGKLVQERTAVVTAHADTKKYRMNIRKLAGYVGRIKKKWGQTSLSVVVETPARPSETLYLR